MERSDLRKKNLHVKIPLKGFLNATIGLSMERSDLRKNLHILKCHYRALKNCMELEFMELEFYFFFFFNFQFVITQLSKNRVLN